ncbi:S41 family peptidase [Lewinella sp. IMCC34191]|uniref:S41 family peptidase n=1 Tax=Lewinella sp. IMCC34191 TaxID=2259172 RepID=UPI0018E53A51|nr:S41 family peptidase [Lewinella sp. IMCC34191]
MKLILPLLIATLGLTAQSSPNWLRHAAISPDGSRIAFTYRGDLYTVPAVGGDANRLTYHDAHDYMATWSADGQRIAFASNRYGNFDVFVMPATGGDATRLTYHSADEMPFAFGASDSTVIFGGQRQDAAEHRQFPTGSQPELYTIPATGGRVGQLLTVPAEYAQVSPDGKTLLYHDKKGGENEYRKHHTSAITRDIWAYDMATGTHRQLTNNAAEERQPVFTADGDGFYYLSERVGNFNVYKRDLSGENDEQLTDLGPHPVRFLSRGGDLLSFGYDGELYTLREGGEPQKVKVNIVTQAGSNTDRFVSVDGDIEEMAVSPDGKEIAFVARGEVFVTSTDESFTKRITTTPERERFVSWGPEGKSVVYASERDGKWSTFKSEKVREEEPFFYAATLLKETPVLENGQDNYLAEYSPDGKRLAWIEDRRTLKVRDIATGKDTTLLGADELFHMRDGDKYFTWSPDSEWLLVEHDVLLNNSEVLLLKADGGKRVNLTESGYYDSRPKWVDKGKAMIWFSNRDGLKSYATSGQSEQDVYAMFFTQAAWDEFNLSEEEYKLQQAIEKANKADDKEEKADDKGKDKKKKEETKTDSTKVEPLTFDWDGLHDRTKRLTIHSSRLGDAVLSKDGEKLYYLSSFEDKMNLWVTNLRTRDTKMALELGAGGGSLQWDKKQENLYLLSSGKITKLDVDKEKKTPVKLQGEIPFDEVAERTAIFDHVWQRTDAIFYRSDFHGANWDSLRTVYAKHLPSIGNDFELVELLSEMLGELNVSHAGARYRPSGGDNPDETAALGIFADYGHTGDGILIEEILDGGPLDRAAFDLKPGMLIERINGEVVSADRDWAAYLNRLEGDFTLLELVDTTSDERTTITVKPISQGEESRLLYKRWVERNEEEVNERSQGRLGYVHIPGMSDEPYRSIYQDMMGKYFEREGMIIDTRFNGGGDLVADLAMFFTGVPFITYATEAKVVGGEPTSRWTKPTLALINEAQYSDGHCFAAGYSDLKIGKTVGMPTPGTCSFAGWERLPNGIVWGVVPVSARDIDGDWMENNQTEPQIKVKNEPAVIATGRDQQLERAVDVMLDDLGSR